MTNDDNENIDEIKKQLLKEQAEWREKEQQQSPESEHADLFSDQSNRNLKRKTRAESEPEPEIQKLNSMDEWCSAVKSKYDELWQVIEDNLPQLWLATEFILAVKLIMNIQGVTLPWFGIILGRPSSLKTAAIELLRDTPNTFYTDIFTPKAFVSNSTAVSKAKLKDIDMLPKLSNKLFLVSELSAIFTKKDDEVIELLGILTRLADGHGLKTNTGAHGDRGYSNIYFNMVGAAVDIPRRVYMHLGYLGPKLYFLRMPKMNKKEDDYVDELDKEEYPIRFQRVREALTAYLNVFPTCPNMFIEQENKLLKVPWSKNDDSSLAKRYIVKLAILLSHLRAVVPTWDTSGHGGTDYAHATAIREEPDRAITQLRNLAIGHALSQGRDYVTLADIPLVIKVVLSTASIDRVNVFDLLIAHKGELKTATIEDSLNMSSPTARATMTELKAIELVEMPKTKTDTEEKSIKLKSGFDWFLTPEFSNLRQGYMPEDNIQYLKKPKTNEIGLVGDRCLKEKIPPSSQLETEPIMMEGCPKCGEKLEPFYMKIHNC